MHVWNFWQFLIVICVFAGSGTATVVGQSNLVTREQAKQVPKAVHPQPVALVVKQHGKTLRKVTQPGLVRHPPKLTKMVEKFLDRSDVSGQPDFLYSQSQFQTFSDGSAEILTQGGMLIRMGSDSLIRVVGAAYRETDGMLGWRVLFGPGDYTLTGITRHNEQEVMNGPLNGGFACIKKDKQQRVTKLPPHDYPITVVHPDQAIMVECRAKISDRFLLPSPVPKSKTPKTAPKTERAQIRKNPSPPSTAKLAPKKNGKGVNDVVNRKQSLQPATRLKAAKQNISGAYYLQVGAFRDKKYAIIRQKKLQKISKKNVNLRQIGSWYKIQVGPFRQRQLAEREGGSIRQKLGFKSFVKKQ